MKIPNMGLFKSRKSLKPKTPGVPNIDWKQLTKRCRQKISSFAGDGFVRIETPEGPYFYKDNGSHILATAHLDTVLGAAHTAPLRLSYDTLFFCPTLDDRLGVYAILDYLPQKGIKYDILLTTGEEHGASTGRYFDPPKGKKYRWMFSFDREGTDVVMYQYKTFDKEVMLKEAGWKTGIGSYSDVVDLEHLRCSGFNFGVGYYASHKLNCYMSRTDFISNMRKFLSFYESWKDEFFPYTPMYNAYTMENGFEYVHYSNKGQNQGTFTDEDLEIIEILEREGFEFPARLTPAKMEETILAYQRHVSDKDHLKNVEALLKQPTLFDDQGELNEKVFKIPLKTKTKAPNNIIKRPTERHEATGRAKRIVKLPLIRETSIVARHFGSEDNLEYNNARAAFDKSRRTKDGELLDVNKNIAVTVVHAGTEGLDPLKKIVERLDKDQMIPIGLDECSQCHKPTEVFLGATTTLCAECKAERSTAEEKVEKAVSTKATRIVAKIALYKPGDKDAQYTYEEDKVGGKGWHWVGSYPKKELQLVA